MLGKKERMKMKRMVLRRQGLSFLILMILICSSQFTFIMSNGQENDGQSDSNQGLILQTISNEAVCPTLKDYTVIQSSEIDPNGPNINILLPLNESFVSGLEGGIFFLINITDPGTNAVINTIPQIQLNSNESWINMIDCSEGNYELFSYETTAYSSVSFHNSILTTTIKVTNNNSISNLFVIELTIDNSYPTITLNAPLNKDEIIYINSDCEFELSARDLQGIDYYEVSSIEMEFTQVFAPYETSIVSFQAIQTDPPNYDITYLWNYTWCAKSNAWLNGKYNVTITATDHAGLETIVEKSIILDTEPPDIQIISPIENAIVSSTLALDFYIADSTTEISEISLIFGINPPIYLNISEANEYHYELNVSSYPNGYLYYSISSTDLTGTKATVISSVLIDNYSPVVAVYGNFSVRGDHIWTVHCSDLNGMGRIAWEINDGLFVDLPIDDIQTFTFNSRLFEDGYYNISFLFEDQAYPANRIIKEYSIVIDNTKPQLALSNFFYGIEIDNRFQLKYQVYDKTAIDLFCRLDDNNISQLSADLHYPGIFSINITEIVNVTGSYIITFIAQDECGNIDVDEYYFILTEHHIDKNGAQYQWAYYLGGGMGLIGVVIGVSIGIRKQKGKKLA